MLPKSICFVDIETSGLNALYNRIIEIGIIKVENGRVVREFNALINPEGFVDPFVEKLTGIKAEDLEKAPTFYELKDELLDILDESVLVAHNVRFDYGFIRNEFKKIGIKFSSKHFCTVKLSRLLYPNLKKHNLDSIIENFNINCINRHRAYDDARVIYEFYEKSKKNIKKELFEQAVEIVLRKPTLPSTLSEKDLEDIPETAGVYIFYGDEGSVLYVGKSVNIRERVMSHFTNDHLSVKDMKISQTIKSIETIVTAGELGALLLESNLVKQYQPLYNRMLRESRKLNVLLRKKNENGYYSCAVEYLENIEIDRITDIVGIFKSQKQYKEYLYNVAKDYKLCPKILGLDKSRSNCFYYHLGQCFGACNGEEISLKYNLRFEEAFYKSKIKNWNFNSAIAISEKGEKEEVYIIDKWCYLGSIKNENESIESIKKEYKFDLDTYKILYRYINNPNNQKFIRSYPLR